MPIRNNHKEIDRRFHSPYFCRRTPAYLDFFPLLRRLASWGCHHSPLGQYLTIPPDRFSNSTSRNLQCPISRQSRRWRGLRVINFVCLSLGPMQSPHPPYDNITVCRREHVYCACDYTRVIARHQKRWAGHVVSGFPTWQSALHATRNAVSLTIKITSTLQLIGFKMFQSHQKFSKTSSRTHPMDHLSARSTPLEYRQTNRKQKFHFV